MTTTTTTNDFAMLSVRADQVELPVYDRIPLVPVRGEGCYLEDATGRRYLDLYGGHAVCLTGHSHPRVAQAIAEQARQLIFYSSVVHSPLRVEASELLLAHAPYPDSRVFHCCSGAEANEAAMKLARKATGRRKIVSFEGSFHGRTIGTLSATGIAKYRQTAGPVLVEEHAYVPFGDEAALAAAVDGDTAAVLCETIQSLAGVYMAPPGFYRCLAGICRARGAALIFDEVQTAIGRSGTYFFGEGVGVKPDMITMAKAIAGGIPAGAVIVAPHLAAGVKMGDHGSTFGGGPVAMAAMRATLQIVESERLVENAARLGERLMQGARAIAGVTEVRGKGLLLGIQTTRPAKEMLGLLLERGIVVGTSSQPNTLRLLPPLVLPEGDVARFLEALGEVLAS